MTFAPPSGTHSQNATSQRRSGKVRESQRKSEKVRESQRKPEKVRGSRRKSEKVREGQRKSGKVRECHGGLRREVRESQGKPEKVPRIWEAEGSWRSEMLNANDHPYLIEAYG